MGRGGKWDPEEATVLAKAWAHASVNTVDGADMTSDIFWTKVHDHFKKNSPKNGRTVEAARGSWAKTLPPAVYDWAGLWARANLGAGMHGLQSVTT